MECRDCPIFFAESPKLSTGFWKPYVLPDLDRVYILLFSYIYLLTTRSSLEIYSRITTAICRSKPHMTVLSVLATFPAAMIK